MSGCDQRRSGCSRWRDQPVACCIPDLILDRRSRRGGIEDRAGLAVAPAGVVTVSGNNFPICSAAQAALGNCVQTFAVNFPTITAGTVPVPITAQNPLRVDNLAPRVRAST